MATFGTFTSGQVLTASELNTVLPACILSTTTASVPNAADTYIPFSSEDYDPLGWHSTSTNTSRITSNIAGWHQATVSTYGLNGPGGNYRIIVVVTKNRSTPARVARFDINNYAPDGVTVSGMFYLNGTTDYLEADLIQFSGSTINNVSVQLSCTLVAR